MIQSTVIGEDMNEESEESEDRDDTNPGTDLQQAILDELRRIRGDLKKFEDRINERIKHMDERVERVVTDLNTIHRLQQTYTSRLAVIEQMCVERPLASAPKVISSDLTHGKIVP